MYEYHYSSTVVANFLKRYPRAWGEILAFYPKLGSKQLVWLFQRDQNRWNYLKKVVQGVHKLTLSTKREEYRGPVQEYLKHMFSSFHQEEEISQKSN